MKYQRLKIQHRDGKVTFWLGLVQVNDAEPFEIAGGAVSPPIDIPTGITIDEKAKLSTGAEKLPPRPTSRVKT